MFHLQSTEVMDLQLLRGPTDLATVSGFDEGFQALFDTSPLGPFVGEEGLLIHTRVLRG